MHAPLHCGPARAYLGVHKDLCDARDVVGDLVAVLQRLAVHQARLVLVGVVGGGNQYVITQEYLQHASHRISTPAPLRTKPSLGANRR